jgi:hypothetical protein
MWVWQRWYSGYPSTSQGVSSLKEREYLFLHFPCFMHYALRNSGPHGPCTMHEILDDKYGWTYLHVDVCVVLGCPVKIVQDNPPVTTLTLGSWPRQGGCKGADQERNSGVTSHNLRRAKSVKARTVTLPSELPFWEFKSQMDSQIFKTRLQGSKLITSKRSLYHWKAIES